MVRPLKVDKCRLVALAQWSNTSLDILRSSFRVQHSLANLNLFTRDLS